MGHRRTLIGKAGCRIGKQIRTSDYSFHTTRLSRQARTLVTNDSLNRSLGPGELQRTLELFLVVLNDRLINTGFLAESKPMLQRSIRVPSFSALAGTVLILISAAAQDFRASALLLWPIPTPHSIQDLARVWTSMPELRIDQRTPYACRSTIRRAGCEEMIPACSPLMKI